MSAGLLKSAACLYVRDAEREIAEWIAYHRVIGIDAFLIYDNGSTDGTAAAAEQMRAVADVRVVPWGHATGPAAQQEAYTDCLARFGAAFEWILFIDSDEFLVSEDNREIGALLASRLFTSGIAFNWACFGSNGHVERPDGLVIESYTRRAPDDFDPNRNMKMIVRPDRTVANRNPHFFDVQGPLHRVDGSVVAWRTPGISDAVDLRGWRVNHYFVRSRADWQAKMERGYRDTVRGAETFGVYDRNETEDRLAARRAPEVRALLEKARERSAGLALRQRFGGVVRALFGGRSR